MKNKIKRLSKGEFHISQPEIMFPETHLTMRVGEGEKYRGSFSLQNQGKAVSEDWSIRLLFVYSVMNRDSTAIRSISTIHMTEPVWYRAHVEHGQVYHCLQWRRI